SNDVLLQLADELFDARRGPDCLLALHAQKRGLAFLIGLVLLVRKIGADRARDEQRAAHQRENRQEAPSKEPPALDLTDNAVLRENRFDRRQHHRFLLTDEPPAESRPRRSSRKVIWRREIVTYLPRRP